MDPQSITWPAWTAPLTTALREALRPQPTPPRVAAAIAMSDRVSEILVGLVQCAGVATFLLLYLATRGAFSAQAGIEPVPLALAIYGAFVIWRLRRAYRGSLTALEVQFSAVADVVVLMGTIWCFTLQYDLPAALYLKAPTLLYVFVLIALRALRFDPMLVALTGALSAAGWLVLVAIAAIDGAPITDNYPTYMTSLSLLWGAEFDKILSILAVTAVLALAVSRARALLVSTAVEQTAAEDLSRFLDPAAALRVRSAAQALQPGDGELKQAAVLFLDLRGFSAAAAKMAPRDVIALLQDYQSRFVPIIEAAGGSVDKYLGDGILVSFGTANSSGREAAQAFDAVPALLQADAQWAQERAHAGNAPLRVAIAITVGEVVHGVIGYDDRLEFTVIGEAVNNAAKLEKHAKLERAQVLATQAAWRQAQAQGSSVTPIRLAPNARVDGIGAPIDLAILA